MPPATRSDDAVRRPSAIRSDGAVGRSSATHSDGVVGHPDPNGRYYNESVLRNLDINNIESIRSVMHCIHEYNSMTCFERLLKNTGENASQISKKNFVVAHRLLKHVKRTMRAKHDLLFRALRQWSAAHDKSENEVKKATVYLIGLASAEILFTPTESPLTQAGYTRAVAKFEGEDEVEELPVVAKTKKAGQVSPPPFY